MKTKRLTRICATLALVLLAGCGAETEPATPSATTAETASEIAPAPAARVDASPDAQLNSLAEEYWQYRLDTEPYTRSRHGLALQRIPSVSYEEALQEAAFAKDMMERLALIDVGRLDHEQALTHQILAWELDARIKAAEFYWLAFDVTPYQSYGLAFLNQTLAGMSLETAEARDAYARLLQDYAALIGQRLSRLEGQAERGIRIPRPAMEGVRATWTGLRAAVEPTLTPAGPRLETLDPAEQQALLQAVSAAINGEILPAFDRLLSYLGDDYFAAAPTSVGVSQYPGGKDYYAYLTRHYTTMEVTPEDVWAFGKQRMAEIGAEMAAVRTAVGFKGTQQEFHEMIRKDPRFLAKTPQDVEDRFNAAIERIEPIVPQYFSLMPKAPYGVKRLDPAMEAGLTFGFYQQPDAGEARGLYRYNGSNLDKRSLIGATSLIYHELIPGHHFHIALQNENESLPMLRREALGFGAFNEGWAEYAASLAGEMGLLEDPYDRYGRLAMDAFLTSRLVVDPGMNYFGWSLEQAREYMLENTMQSDLETASETLRYATDLPGQALGYKMGHKRILDLRRDAEASLGEAFDIRAFHSVMLGSGAMGMDILSGHVNWYIQTSAGGLPATEPGSGQQ